MAHSDKVLCDEWVATLRNWVDAASSSFGPDSKHHWVLDEAAFERVKPLFASARSEDIAALFAAFGAGLLHSLLVSFEQGPIHVRGPSLGVVDGDSGEFLAPA